MGEPFRARHEIVTMPKRMTPADSVGAFVDAATHSSLTHRMRAQQVGCWNPQAASAKSCSSTSSVRPQSE
jgi:hypothetical protein